MNTMQKGMKCAGLILALTTCSVRLMADEVRALQLEIGPVGANQVGGTTGVSGAIGSGNDSGGSSLTIGTANSAVWYSLAAGDSNTVAFDSVALGSGNTGLGSENILLGYGNFAAGGEDLISYQNVLAGRLNHVFYEVGGSFAGGVNNVIEGNIWITPPEEVSGAIVLGIGLYSHWSGSAIVGQYNADVTSPLAFAVGNGVAANQRSNALEIHLDGTIRMPAQGDVLMGEFGEP